MDKKETVNEQNVIRPLDDSPKVSFSPKILTVFVMLAILGAFSGFLLSRTKLPAPTSSSSVSAQSITTGSVFGSNDLKTFKDTVEGTLKKGGIDGEGQYHLVRPGGDSQNVYLTSSAVDLSLFVDKKIKVWGQTQAAQTAGWLMDVGRVEVL
jgi:hypothetical protein